MSDKYIFKKKRSENYTVLPNELIHDTRLSWEARGLLIYLLSKPEDWTVRKTDLERQSQANDFVVSRILKELEEKQYIRREKFRNEKGQWDWRTWVFDQPIPQSVGGGGNSDPQITIPQSTTDGKPPDIVNTDIPSTKDGGDLVDAILFYSQKENQDVLHDYPVDVKPYLKEFIDKFKRNPVSQEKSGWIKEARKWKAMGIRPEDIPEMYDLCREQGTHIKSPFSITFAYDTIRQEEPVGADWDFV